MYRFYPNFIASLIAEKVVNNNDDLLTQKEEIRYGLEWIISFSNQIFIITLLSLPLNILSESIMFVIACASLRMFSGGAHLNGYLSCLVFSTIQVILFSFASKLLSDYMAFELPITIILLISLLYVGLKAPVLNKKKGLFSKQQKRHLKYASIAVFLLLCVISMTFLKNTSYMYSIWFALLSQSFSLSPVASKSYLVIGNFWNGKGGGN